MGTIEDFIERSQQRLGSLTAGPSSSFGWNAAERKALRDLGAEILPRAGNDLRTQKIRVYLELDAGARKPLLMAAALWPELRDIGQRGGLAPALFVTEPAVRRLYEPYLSDPAAAIHDWTESANLLGGIGGHHNSIFYIADIDTEQPSPLGATRQWVSVARAIGKLTTNQLANFVMIHQRDKHALDPTAV